MSPPTEPALQPHRNHGLFSDHYLDVTLPERPGWNFMVEQARPVMEEISRLFATFTPSANEAQTERDLVRPILKILNHAYEVRNVASTELTLRCLIQRLMYNDGTFIRHYAGSEEA